MLVDTPDRRHVNVKVEDGPFWFSVAIEDGTPPNGFRLMNEVMEAGYDSILE